MGFGGGGGEDKDKKITRQVAFGSDGNLAGIAGEQQLDEMEEDEEEAEFAARKGREHVEERQRQIIEEEKARKEEEERQKAAALAAFQSGQKRISTDFPGRRQTILTRRPAATGHATFLTGLS
jgi:hypothetical protein